MAYRQKSRGMGATALANAIFRQEGVLDSSGNWITSSLGYRLNNPGNLNYAGQPGCHPTTLGNGQEAQCDSLDIGIQATDNQLALDASRGLTLQQRLSTWATGNPSAYVSNVSNWLGVDPNTPLSEVLAGGGSAPPPDSGSIPVDSGSIDPLGTFVDTSQAGLSPVAMAGLGLAALGVLWAVS